MNIKYRPNKYLTYFNVYILIDKNILTLIFFRNV